MYKVINVGGKPIKMWVTDIEDGALEQAENLSNLPFLFKHVALMPDCHQGFGCPIGSVAALEDIICPNLIGVDIGCGMLVAKTSATTRDMTEERIKNFMSGVRNQIPVGMKSHKAPQDCPGLDSPPNDPIVMAEVNNARYQIGTLGGGKLIASSPRE